MHTINSLFKNVQAFSLLVGMAFGAAIGLVLFSYMVPDGQKMIRLYHSKVATIQANKNEKNMKILYSTTTATVKAPASKMEMAPTNHYTVSPVTSERQFLKEMKLHHEAAVVMANQALKINGLHPDVRSLAESIISTQTTEIKIMKDWITAWKY